MSRFYGEWQTRGWKPQAAANGKVPRNDRGNVEVPPFASALPEGTVSSLLPTRPPARPPACLHACISLCVDLALG